MEAVPLLHGAHIANAAKSCNEARIERIKERKETQEKAMIGTRVEDVGRFAKRPYSCPLKHKNIMNICKYIAFIDSIFLTEIYVQIACLCFCFCDK